MQSDHPIKGVWKVSAILYRSREGDTRIEPALPGLFIFTEKHYSMTWMPGRQMQTDYADLWHPSDGEKVESYNSIVTNSGRYKLAGSQLTTFVQVAKTPAFVGGKAVYHCEMADDKLTLEILDNVAHDGTRDAAYLTFKSIIYLERIE